MQNIDLSLRKLRDYCKSWMACWLRGGATDGMPLMPVMFGEGSVGGIHEEDVVSWSRALLHYQQLP